MFYSRHKKSDSIHRFTVAEGGEFLTFRGSEQTILYLN